MKIHFIQHEVFEAPGAFHQWALRRGYEISFSKVFEMEPLPEQVDHIHLLIVMGGPQSPDTTISECAHFDAGKEMTLINSCIEHGRAVIGVCLGAQLIGKALGAEFGQSPQKEIGVFPITLTEDGLADERLAHFGETLTVGHWHNDMPGLTPESKVLATSIGCPRQIIAYGEFVYGFQCHMELNKEVAALLIEADQEVLSKADQYQFVQKATDILEADFTEMNEKLFTFLDKFVADWLLKRKDVISL